MSLPGMPAATGSRKNGILIPGSIIERPDDLSTYTLADVPVPGAEHAKRGFGVVFAATSGVSNDLTGVTIGGVAAAFTDFVDHNGMIVGVAWSPLPEGDDTDVVVTIAGTKNRFVALPFSTFDYVPDAVFKDGGVQSPAVAAVVKAGGAVIAVSGTNIVGGTMTLGGIGNITGSNTWENANNQYAFGHEGPLGAQTKNITATGSAAPGGDRAALLALTLRV